MLDSVFAVAWARGEASPIRGVTARGSATDYTVGPLEHLELKEPPAPHVAHRRMALAGMVLCEVELDDVECFALRGLAAAVIDLCRWPTDPEVIMRYLDARQLRRDVLQAAYDGG